MLGRSLLLNIALLGLFSGVKSQYIANPNSSGSDDSVPDEKSSCHYMLTVPVLLKSTQTAKVCINVQCTESTTLTINLEFGGSVIPIFDEPIAASYFECRDFEVPAVSAQQFAYVIISIVGETVERKGRRDVIIDKMPEACIVHLEKRLYKPGDTVRFLIVCIKNDLKPSHQNISSVYLVDPLGARIMLVLVPPSENNIISVEIPLNVNAAPGYYTLQIQREPYEPIFKSFEVELYKLPRFQSQVTCPNTISIMENYAKVEVSSTYVYGKPLPGTVIGKCCRRKAYSYGRQGNCYPGMQDICVEFTAELESGAYTETLDMAIFKLYYSEYQNSIQCEVIVKEAGTAVLETQYCYIFITSQPISLQFVDPYYQYYRHGLYYHFAARLTDENDKPITHANISIAVEGIEVKIATTDDEGRVECKIDTTPYSKPNFTLSISYLSEDQCYISNDRGRPFLPYHCYHDYPFASRVVYRFFSESDCYVQIIKITEKLSCHETYSIEIEYKVTEDGVGEGATSTSFFYLVKANEEIALHGHEDVDLSTAEWLPHGGGWRGIFHIDLTVPQVDALSAQFFIYGLVAGEVISDIWEIALEACFLNEVSLAFPEEIVRPGSEVVQEITAAPNSMCGIRMFDASLQILGAIDFLTPEQIYNVLRYYYYGYDVKDLKIDDPVPACEDPNTVVYCHGRYYRQVSSTTDGDTHGNLLALSLAVNTNLRLWKPQVCGMEEFEYPHDECSPIFFARAEAFDKASSGGSSVTFRSIFEDTFGGQIVFTGPDGRGTTSAVCPDTVTTWFGDVLCISEAEGLGITTGTASFEAFLYFFLEMTFPPFCTRGEKIFVVVSIANYLETCVKVESTLESSDDSAPILLNGNSGACICKGERVSYQWSLEFTALGKINLTATATTAFISTSAANCDGDNDDSAQTLTDIVVQGIHVDPEGIPQQVTSSHLVRLQGSPIAYEVTINPPENVVPGSFEIVLQVTGDPIGPVVENLERLLLLPDGCCLQNLARLLPVVICVEYLKATSGINDELLSRAMAFFAKGYAGQLPCRTSDGLYSQFRNSYIPDPRVLLLTYVTFDHMKNYTYVDPEIQKQALLQIGKLQNLTTGCFHPSGPDSKIQDKENVINLFTAFALINLLQAERHGTGDTLINNGLRCLERIDIEVQDLEILCSMLHVAALAKLYALWEDIFGILAEKKITRDGRTYWDPKNSGSSTYYFLQNRYTSLQVRCTSSVMLGILRSPNVPEHMDLLGEIALFLSSCQTARGGFVDTQDTLVAMEAITLYSRLIYAQNTNIEVSVSSGDKEVAKVIITNENRLLVQRQDITGYGTFSVAVSGEGNCMVQLVTGFYIAIPAENSLFSLTATSAAETCTEGVAPVISITVCASYTGEGETSMVLFDIKLLTGYSADGQSVYDLLTNGKISDYEIVENHVYIYLASMKSDEEVCLPVKAYLDQRAMLYKSSSVTLTKYDDPDHAAFAEFYYPCSSVGQE